MAAFIQDSTLSLQILMSVNSQTILEDLTLIFKELHSRYERKLFSLGATNMVSSIATVLANNNLQQEGINFLQKLSVTVFGKIVENLEKQQKEDSRNSLQSEEKGENGGNKHKGAIN